MMYLYKRLALILSAAVWLGFVSSCSGDLPEGETRLKKVDFQNIVQQGDKEAEKAKKRTLKIAVAAMISPKYTYDYYVELLNLIAEQMGCDVEFIQKKTYAQVNEMLRQRELDMAFVCSGPYVTGRDDFGLDILVVPVSHGKKVYHSYFIVNKDSAIRSLDQLRGKTFAFTDPHSNTGCLVPNFVLARRGETPETFFKETFFSNSHDNSIKAVAEGLADGAAVDSLIWEFMNMVNPEITKRTKIIEKSPPYGIPPVVVHPSMDEPTKNKFRNIFLGIHKHPKGKEILSRLQIDRFEPGNDADYDTVREMQRWIASRH
ncbi:MAG: phosphate/phosphite/phosphonate ABC transporter substrate-binding protein [Thermodesulfobacteriota bacterium]